MKKEASSSYRSVETEAKRQLSAIVDDYEGLVFHGSMPEGLSSFIVDKRLYGTEASTLSEKREKAIRRIVDELPLLAPDSGAFPLWFSAFPEESIEVLFTAEHSISDAGVCLKARGYCFRAGMALSCAVNSMKERELQAKTAERKVAGAIDNLIRALTRYPDDAFRYKGTFEPGPLSAAEVAVVLADIGLLPNGCSLTRSSLIKLVGGPHHLASNKEALCSPVFPRRISCASDLIYFSLLFFSSRRTRTGGMNAVRRCPICGRLFFANPLQERYCPFPCPRIKRKPGKPVKSCSDAQVDVRALENKRVRNADKRLERMMESSEFVNCFGCDEEEAFIDRRRGFFKKTKGNINRNKLRLKWLEEREGEYREALKTWEASGGRHA